MLALMDMKLHLTKNGKEPYQVANARTKKQELWRFLIQATVLTTKLSKVAKMFLHYFPRSSLSLEEKYFARSPTQELLLSMNLADLKKENVKRTIRFVVLKLTWTSNIVFSRITSVP